MDIYGKVQWRSVIGIYVDNPSTIHHRANDTPQIPTPGRESLQLSVVQRVGHGEKHLIDLTSLATFASLWRQHGLRVQVQQREDIWNNVTDLLVPSYCQSGYYDSAQPEDAILNSLRQLAALAL
jgi:hypothetical protein